MCNFKLPADFINWPEEKCLSYFLEHKAEALVHLWDEEWENKAGLLKHEEKEADSKGLIAELNQLVEEAKTSDKAKEALAVIKETVAEAKRQKEKIFDLGFKIKYETPEMGPILPFAFKIQPWIEIAKFLETIGPNAFPFDAWVTAPFFCEGTSKWGVSFGWQSDEHAVSVAKQIYEGLLKLFSADYPEIYVYEVGNEKICMLAIPYEKRHEEPQGETKTIGCVNDEETSGKIYPRIANPSTIATFVNENDPCFNELPKGEVVSDFDCGEMVEKELERKFGPKDKPTNEGEKIIGKIDDHEAKDDIKSYLLRDLISVLDDAIETSGKIKETLYVTRNDVPWADTNGSIQKMWGVLSHEGFRKYADEEDTLCRMVLNELRENLEEFQKHCVEKFSKKCLEKQRKLMDEIHHGFKALRAMVEELLRRHEGVKQRNNDPFRRTLKSLVIYITDIVLPSCEKAKKAIAEGFKVGYESNVYFITDTAARCHKAIDLLGPKSDAWKQGEEIRKRLVELCDSPVEKQSELMDAMIGELGKLKELVEKEMR